MIKYLETPNTTEPDYSKYEVIVDVIPAIGFIPSESMVYCQKDVFQSLTRLPGKCYVVKDDNKLYVGMVAALEYGSPSTLVYTVNGISYRDSIKDREVYIKQCFEEFKQLIDIKHPIISPLFLTKDYKDYRKKYLSNIEYFVKNYINFIPTEYDWTLHHPNNKRHKTINEKIHFKD